MSRELRVSGMVWFNVTHVVCLHDCSFCEANSFVVVYGLNGLGSFIWILAEFSIACVGFYEYLLARQVLIV